VLVTGGAGFVGSHVVDGLVAGGHDVVVVDRRPGTFANAEARYVVADLADEAAWSEVLGGVDAVSHQAARVGLGTGFGDVQGYVTDNDSATAVLLAALDRTGFAGRLVLASSMVVYGEGAYRCATCGPVRAGPRTEARLSAGLFEPPCPNCRDSLVAEEVSEDAPLDPRNVYAATKVHQEHLVAVFGRERGLPVTILRYHNVYGPRSPEDTPYAGVASLFLAALRRGGVPQVFEDGGQRRDFVHVRDVARANLLALTADDAGGVCNVASGRPTTVLELATALSQCVGDGGRRPVVTGGYRLGDVRHVMGSTARAARELGFTASVPLDEGLAELADQGEPVAAAEP